jgi:hypothetical protein
MADDASYLAFLQRANNPPSGPSSSTETTTSTDDPTKSNHPFLALINNKLANLSAKTFTTETDSDFHAIFVSSSLLPSWSSNTDSFPAAMDLESQVEGGRNGKVLTVGEWDIRGEYTAVVESIMEVTLRNDVKVYTVQGRGGRFEVFVVAKMDDGLVGVKASGVET